jgi:trichohyalin
MVVTQSGSVEGMDAKNPRKITTPRSIAALDALFYKQEDLWMKDYSSLKDKFNTADEYSKFVDKELQRVNFRIEKVQEKRQELIKLEEKQRELKMKHQQHLKKHKLELSQNQKELEKIEKELRQQEEQMKKEKAKKDEESTRPETRGSKYRQSDDADSKRTHYSLAYLQQVKPRVENLSFVAPRPQEYFEIHSKVRKIKDFIDLGEATSGNLKTRQQKEIEMIINHEFKLKQKLAESEQTLRKRIEVANSKLQQKFLRYEETIEKLEEERNHKLFQKDMDREYKVQNVERAKKSFEYNQQIKKNKIEIEDERMQEMRQELADLKHQRTFFRKNLLEDLANRQPDEDIAEIVQRYKTTLESQSVNGLTAKTNSGFSKLPKLNKPVRKHITNLRSGSVA